MIWWFRSNPISEEGVGFFYRRFGEYGSKGMHPFPAIGYGLIVSLGLHLLVNPFTKPEPEEHLNRIFGRR